MSQALARQAFETRLNTWALAQVPPIPVAFENSPFTAPVGVYLRAFVLPAAGSLLDLGGTLEDTKGVYQVSIASPIDRGTKLAADIVASLKALFAPSAVMLAPVASPLVRIWLLKPFGPAPAVQEPDRYVVPVSAPYECLAI